MRAWCNSIEKPRFAYVLDTIPNIRTQYIAQQRHTNDFSLKWETRNGIGKETARKHTQRNELGDITRRAMRTMCVFYQKKEEKKRKEEVKRHHQIELQE